MVVEELTLFDAVTPREDVLAGTITDAIFAASLDEVVAGTAPSVYGDAATFFDGTHPSAGLRSVLDEALGRIGGGRPDGASVIRLETNLGGGKTHNLIALYHSARGELPSEQTADFMTAELRPASPVDQIAVFVGTGAGATSFPEVDGIRANTLWGYLALQLGGSGAYDEVKGDDEGLTAPGAPALKKIIGDRSTLILIDEIARYLETASGKAVGASTLARQTTSFLMALMEAVDSCPRASLVITTTEVTDAFGESTQAVLDAIAEARALLARREHVLRPSEEADLPRILARRLFVAVDGPRARDVAGKYAKTVEDAEARGVDLPEAMEGPRWPKEIEESYPFHPTLIRVLDKRLSTIPNFQRTRGALRLLARTVRSLWQERPEGADLIRVDHVDLGDKDVAEDLSSRLDRATLEPVIRADIASQPGGEPSHAEVVDAAMGGRNARRLATAAYLFSLTSEVPGVSAGELIGSVLSPADDPSVAQKALDDLAATAWYLHDDARGYRFSTEINLNRLMEEAIREVTTQKTKQRATAILAEQFKDSALKIRRAWEDAKVPDRADDAYLVLLHWDDFPEEHGVDPVAAPPGRVRDLWERAPAGGLREFRNRLVLLVPIKGTHQAMLNAVRRHLALAQLAQDAETLSRLSPEKRTQLIERAKESELEARIAVCNHVNLLYVPQANGLEAIELDVVTQGSVKRNQSEAILDRLAAMEKTLAAGDKPLDPSFIKTKLGAQLDGPFPTSEIPLVFARRTDLKLVLDKAKLTELVAAGVRNGVWEYHDAGRGEEGWATKERPEVAVRLADDAYLYPVGSAPAPGEKPCPFCGEVHAPGPCPGEETPDGGAKKTSFTAEGSAAAAYADARQQAMDAGRKRIEELRVQVNALGAGTGAELQRLHSLVLTSDADVELGYGVRLELAFDGAGRRLTLDFTGTPPDYAPLKDALRQAIGSREATLAATLTARFGQPTELGGEFAGRIAQRAADTGPSKCRVTIVTEEPDGKA